MIVSRHTVAGKGTLEREPKSPGRSASALNWQSSLQPLSSFSLPLPPWAFSLRLIRYSFSYHLATMWVAWEGSFSEGWSPLFTDVGRQPKGGRHHFLVLDYIRGGGGGARMHSFLLWPWLRMLSVLGSLTSLWYIIYISWNTGLKWNLTSLACFAQGNSSNRKGNESTCVCFPQASLATSVSGRHFSDWVIPLASPPLFPLTLVNLLFLKMSLSNIQNVSTWICLVSSWLDWNDMSSARILQGYCVFSSHYLVA